MAVVDYHSLTRKELQTLCKKHGIPANKKNSFMADALTSVLKVDKPNKFGSATPTNLPVGNKSIPSTLKIQNNRGDLTASKVPYGSMFVSLEIRSQRKQLIEEDAITSTLDTHTDNSTGEKSKRGKEKIDYSDTTKRFEAEQVLLHVSSTGTDDWKEVYHHANQETEPSPNSPIALYGDVLEEFCQQAKFVTRKGDGYSLCCTSNSTLCKDVNDRLDNDTKTYIHDWKTTADVRRVDHLGQEDLCQQAKFVTRKGDEYSLCCTSNSSLCKDVNDRREHDTKIYTHDEQTTIDVQRVGHLGQDKYATRNADEESLHCMSSFSPCLVVNVGDTHEDRNSPDHEERPIHIGEVDLLYQEKEISTKQQEENDIDSALSLSCERLETHIDNDKEMNSQGHIDIDTKEMVIDDETVKHDQSCNQPPSCRGNDKENNTKDKEENDSDKEENDIIPSLSLSCERLDNHIDNDKQMNSQGHIDIDAKEMVIDDETVKHDQPCTQPPSCRGSVEENNSQRLNTDDRKDLFEKEMVIFDEVVKHDQPCNRPPSCRGHGQVRKSMVNIQSAEVSNKPSSFQFSVSCDNGIKLLIDLENTSSSEWMKTHNYEFSFCQELDEYKHCEHSELKSASCPTICKVDVTEENREVMSDKLTDFQPLTSDFERFSDQNLTTCSSKFLRSQNFCSIWPFAFSKKSDVSKELRCTSSLLIPPHGANRSLAPFMTTKSSRLSSTLSPENTINVSFPPSAIGDSHKSVSSQDYQITDKKVESLSQMNSAHNSQKEMHYKSLLEDLQVEKNRTISRYKDEYKKSPFTKYLRGMKDLSRAATIRAEILARRRGLPVVGNTSVFHNLRYQKENVEGKGSQDEIQRVKIGNENCASPQVYCKTDLYVSSAKREREDPLIIPSAYLSVSHIFPQKDSMHNFYNIAAPLAHNGTVIRSTSTGLPRDEALQSSTIIIESNPKLSEGQYSKISHSVHQEKLISVYGLIPGKEILQDIGSVSTPSASAEPVMAHVSTGMNREEERQNNITRSNCNPKLPGLTLQLLAKKRFFEKARAESTERMQAQRTQHHDVNHLSGQMKFSEKVPNNRNNTEYLLSLNLTNSCVLETEDGPTEKVGESQTRHYELLKTPQSGKSKEKAIEGAKNKACFEKNEVGNNTENLLDFNWINSYMLETEDGHKKRVSGRQKRHQELLKTSLRWNSKEKAVKVAKEMALVQRNEIINLKRGITSVNLKLASFQRESQQECE